MDQMLQYTTVSTVKSIKFYGRTVPFSHGQVSQGYINEGNLTPPPSIEITTHAGRSIVGQVTLHYFGKFTNIFNM